jgi:hypothetical protein
MSEKLGPIAQEWVKIKAMYDKNTNRNFTYGENFEIGGELDQMIEGFVEKLAKLTEHYGYRCIVDGVKMDLWKDRIWNLCENAGLLPPLPKSKQEEDEDEITDEWGETVLEEDNFNEEEFDKQIYNN